MFGENEERPQQFDRILPRLLATKLAGEALEAVQLARHENAATTLLSTGDESCEDA